MPFTPAPRRSRCRILHVTDNEADYRLLAEVVRDDERLSLAWAPTGESALELLGRPPSRESPNVVLLSWVLPMLSGEEMLRTMKADEKLRTIPVIVSTFTVDVADVQRMYALGASCVVDKPHALDEFYEVIRGFALFWGRVAVLPFCSRANAAS